MITISDSSHTDTKRRNKEKFEEVNDLLLLEDCPLEPLFQDETLFLDSTDGYVGIQYHTYIDIAEYATYPDLLEFVDWLRTKVEVSNIFIGDFVFTGGE